jgi:Domain of unknown function (DUF6457)
MDDWLSGAQDRIAAAVADEPGVYSVSDEDAELLLALAGVAAHTSGDRTNAPLVTFLAGLALGRHSDRSLAEIVQAARTPSPK